MEYGCCDGDGMGFCDRAVVMVTGMGRQTVNINTNDYGQ